MKIQIKPCEEIQAANSDLIGLFQYQDETTPIKNSKLSKKIQQGISNAKKKYNFKAARNKILEVDLDDQKFLLIGLGTKKENNLENWINATYKLVQKANQLKVKSLTLLAKDSCIRQTVEGVYFGSYRFQGLFKKQDPDKQLTVKTVSILTEDKNVGALVKQQQKVFEAVSLARDLVNLPSNIVTPSYLEKEAKTIAREPKVTMTAIDLKQAQKLNMGAFVAVAKGSKEPAKMIILEYKGNPKSTKKIGIVGKAITFDSGGISLKTPKGMGEMKTDMGGGAAALATFKAVSSLGLKVNLIIAVPATENMPGGNAYKPGDILTASNGKTIEVVSTDAEGRLVMSDALVYLQKKGATKVIDIATLTGACIVTFGHIHTAIMTNDKQWKDSLMKAAEMTAEKFWELPMDKEYDELIKSDICDMMNAVESREAGTITAGKLLEQFIEKGTKWLHLDVAGTAFHTKSQKYYGKYATGIPARTLIEMIKGEENK